MDTDSDLFGKHRKLIEFLMSPESWGRAKYDTSEILFYSSVVREEYTGSLNENQKHLLSIVNHHAETLSESLDIFTMASRLLFSPKHIEIQEVNLLDRLAQLEKEFNKEKYPDLQIEKVIENDLSVFPFDVNPEWFIVHTITKLHRGEFSIDDSHKNECIFYLKVPLQQTDS